MCICMCVCVYVCVYVRMSVCVYVCMYVYMYVYIYVCVCVYVYKNLKTMSLMSLLKAVLINNGPRQIRQQFPSKISLYFSTYMNFQR